MLICGRRTRGAASGTVARGAAARALLLRSASRPRTEANASAAATRPAPIQIDEAPRRAGTRTTGMAETASRAASHTTARSWVWLPAQTPVSRAGTRARRASGGSAGACSSKQTTGARPGASWPPSRQRAIGSTGDASAWHPLQLPTVGTATVARRAGRNATAGTSASTPGAKRRAGASGAKTTP